MRFAHLQRERMRTMDDETVTGWAVAAQRGDRDSAAAFIHATTSQVRRLVSYLSDPGQADDLTQETYLRAFSALPRYAGRAPARLWLLSIARRVAADHVRAAGRRPRYSTTPVDDVIERHRATPGPDGWVALQQAVAALPADRREAFVLTSVLGLAYAEAAELCGCAVGTIRSRVFRARADLVTALGYGDEPGAACGS